MDFPKIDVIIPCYNAAATLARALNSALNQPHLGKIWIIDDGSTDGSLALAQQFAQQYPQQIQLEQMPQNSGAAKARNWGALQSAAEFIAFLDADDAYQPEALTVASSVFYFRPEILLVRLALQPVDFPEHYLRQANFDWAWQHIAMTVAGNMVFRRSFFLACGGFPQQQLFRELGGEDGALGIATTKIASVATLFQEAGVLHYYHQGIHAERLLNAILFNQRAENVTPEKIAQAEAVTAQICQQIEQLKCGLNSASFGVQPLILQRE